MNNIFIFIIWKNAYKHRKEIILDIKDNFNIRNIIRIKWDSNKWEENLSRLYGAKLEDIKAKIKECGKEEFTLIILEDPKPVYKKRTTSHGEEIVNINMFDKKNKYRELTGGGFLIHASNSIKETNHDLTLLLGFNIEDYLVHFDLNKNEVEYKNNVIGCDGWNNISDILYVLNNCCNYVVLRDFENDLEELNYNANYDADILCDNLSSTVKVLNAKQIYINDSWLYQMKLNNKYILFDIKYVGDDYYCESLEKDILNNREVHHGYYIPNSSYLYNSHLLHALIHKDNFESEYNKRLSELYKNHSANKDIKYYIKQLSKWMINNGYTITIYKNNPNKTNINNIHLFDNKLYDSMIIKELEYNKKINCLIRENDSLKNELAIIKNTKGYKILELLRKIIIKVKNIIIK